MQSSRTGKREDERWEGGRVGEEGKEGREEQRQEHYTEF